MGRETDTATEPAGQGAHKPGPLPQYLSKAGQIEQAHGDGSGPKPSQEVSPQG